MFAGLAAGVVNADSGVMSLRAIAKFLSSGTTRTRRCRGPIVARPGRATLREAAMFHKKVVVLLLVAALGVAAVGYAQRFGGRGRRGGYGGGSYGIRRPDK